MSARLETRLEMLEAENDTLRERIEQLESERGAGLVMPVEWMLTAGEERLMALLLVREQATKDVLLTAFAARVDADEEPEIKIVDVVVCKMRRKMAPFGLTIRTIWGRGYAIDEPQRSQFRARCAGLTRQPLSPQPRTAARSAAQDGSVIDA